MAIREKDTWIFHIDQINRTNTASIEWDINNLGWVSNSSYSVLWLLFSRWCVSPQNIYIFLQYKLSQWGDQLYLAFPFSQCSLAQIRKKCFMTSTPGYRTYLRNASKAVPWMRVPWKQKKSFFFSILSFLCKWLHWQKSKIVARYIWQLFGPLSNGTESFEKCKQLLYPVGYLSTLLYYKIQ